MKAREIVVGVDVDEVCADLLGAWLLAYNRDHKDNLLPENVTGWNLAPFVKDAAKKDIYRYLDNPHLYDAVLPIPYARWACHEMLARGYRVVFVTSCHRNTIEAKRAWLRRWGFLTPKNEDRDFCPVYDKSLIRADYLFDDRPENVQRFPGVGVMVSRAHNEAVNHPYRVASLREAPEFIRLMEMADYRSLKSTSPALVSLGGALCS